SFNPTLFCKEFQKAVERLLPFEIEELMIWMKPMLLQHPELATCVPLLPK
ncbi:hypothetical protein FNJ87_18465, partial [Nonlabens mediterrranea]|nr:hypothetical protein [Nonlabens mediterrranea]